MGECLTVETQYASMRERLSCHYTRIVDEEFHREIICSVNDEVIFLDDVEGV